MLAMVKKRTKPIPKRLTALRERLGLTQADAAKKIHVSLRSWAAWELGEAEPSKAHIYLIELLEKGQLP